jgi:hypothetical protein
MACYVQMLGNVSMPDIGQEVPFVFLDSEPFKRLLRSET